MFEFIIEVNLQIFSNFFKSNLNIVHSFAPLSKFVSQNLLVNTGLWSEQMIYLRLIFETTFNMTAYTKGPSINDVMVLGGGVQGF